MSASAPPPYEETAGAPARPDVDPVASFADLKIDSQPHDPDPDTCLAHLKLLFAFQALKEDVGYTDGLFGIWDSRADGAITVAENGEVEEHVRADGDVPDDEEKRKALSKIREKRWALFVARAVDRYEAWWNSLTGGRPLTEKDMEESRTTAYEAFALRKEHNYWSKKALPPLDVLMVFHAHLLNPTDFLEDCIRKGYRQFWQSGLPWTRVNATIDQSFNYTAPDSHKARWVAKTGRQWDNVDDSLVKSLSCPVCTTKLEIPWTTCGLEENPKTLERPGLIGSGYGDGKLEFRCSKCATLINKELLSVAKFCNDSKNLLVKHYPMPGTILKTSNGIPERWTRTAPQRWDHRTFPNRMIQLILSVKIHDLLNQANPDQPPTMETVRKMIQDEVLMKQSSLRTIHESSGAYVARRRLGVPSISRMCIRKMMSRYWENFSPFALDLCGAILRQGIFSEKMCKIDWLHSPTARETMARFCTKYERFMSIMAKNASKVAVPTLDIDLPWHTHQLTPFSYYQYTTRVAARYIRHDDKIEEGQLSEAFEWTSKEYQETYGEVYSECTCWYCESVRTSHVSSVGKVLGLSKNEKVAENFHQSGAASLCPPDNSAHISSHNAVRAPGDILLATSHAERVKNHLQQLHQRRLEENYQKHANEPRRRVVSCLPRNSTMITGGTAITCTDRGCILFTLLPACTMPGTLVTRLELGAGVGLEIALRRWRMRWRRWLRRWRRWGRRRRRMWRRRRWWWRMWRRRRR
ncbi:hypothetical protein CDV31_012423, partial [Fusarium ambrosium]